MTGLRHRSERILPPWRPLIVALSILAGFSLTMAELARPYVLLLLPLLVVGAYLVLRHDRRALLAFAVPLVVFSGVWHVHLYAAVPVGLMEPAGTLMEGPG